MKLIFITGARSEYGISKRLLSRLKESKNHLLRILPIGMHWSEIYGYTVSEIIHDGFEVEDPIDCFL